jgi:dienelactone hydrolase
MRARARAGLEVLARHPKVDAKRLAAIGYCFGGTTVLELARAGEPLLAVVSFHGNLSAPVPAKKGEVKAIVQVHHGAEDTFVTREVVEGFHKEMADAGVRFSVTEYAGAVHSFTVKEAGTDRSTGLAYNEVADLASWRAMKELLAKTLAAK